jgi:DNA-binding transcriptional LysR family regulator
MDRFEDMQTFVRVVEAGSISGAAEQLDVAKSAVSRRLTALEQRLGVQLVTRTTRRMRLTDTGRAYYERCVRLLDDLEEAERAVRAEHRALSGRLRVSVPLTFGIHHLTPAIVDFASQHPELTVDLEFNDRRVDLVEEGLDLAIRIGRLPDSSLVARRIAPIRHVVCASPAYWDRRGRPVHPDALAGHDALIYTLRADPDSWDYTDPAGRSGVVKVTGRMRANNGEFLRLAGIAGQGVMMQPTFIVWEAIRDGLLEPVLSDHEWFPINAYAVYPQARHLSSRVRAFVDFLVRRFGDRPYWDLAA